MRPRDNHVELGAGAARIRIVAVEEFVELDAVCEAGERLVVLISTDSAMDDPLAFSGLTKRIGPQGLLSCIRVEHLPATVLDLAQPAAFAARWLAGQESVVVACIEPVSVPLASAAMFVAIGLNPPEAIIAVEKALPGSFDDIDLEIAVSVARDHIVEHRRCEAMPR